jgi:signal transduction histidine kinase
MNERSRTILLFASPGLLLAAGVLAVASQNLAVDGLIGASLTGIGIILIWSVAAAVRIRYPDRPLGLLLFLLAGAHASQILLGSANPYLFTIARAMRPLVEVLLIWIMLAFPSGRLQHPPERAVVIGGVLAIAFLWLPSLLFSTTIPIAGPIVLCHPECPPNIFLASDQPVLALWLHRAFRGIGALIFLVTAATLFARLRQATPLMRRALAPVFFASIARSLAIAAFLATGSFSFGLTLTLWAIPLAVALGLLRGRLYIANALQRLVAGLRKGPDIDTLRAVMAEALSDDSLAVVYWVPETAHWIDANGKTVELPKSVPGQGRAVTVVRDAIGQPVAALIHDAAILETPTLMEAVTSSMLTALENHRIEAELKTTRATAASAVEVERHRIERDLHDGAQQRLIAMRMKLSVTARLFDQDQDRAKALVGELGRDVEAAIVELRTYAHGVVPPLLAERGLADALAEAAQRAGMPTRVDVENVGRWDPGIERAIYFCCLEALQNAAKHAGAGATAQLTLRRDDDSLCFSVSDDGAGLRPSAQSPAGHGVKNMRERIEAVGGTLDIANREGGGTAITGQVRLRQARS